MSDEKSNQDRREQPLLCPVCGKAMDLRQVHFNQVDVCEEHGIWLDTGELESIVSRLKQSGRRVATKAAREARTEGKMDMWLFGPLSFLFDRPRKRSPRKKTRAK